MKIILLRAFILIAIFSNSHVTAQVYSTTYGDQTIYFGPENVLVSYEGAKVHYSGILQNEIMRLQGIKDRRDSLMSKPKLKKKEKRELKKMHLGQELLNQDLYYLNILKDKWQTYDEQILINIENQCYSYTDGYHTYSHDKLDLQISETEDLVLLAFVNVETEKSPNTKWEKRKVRSGFGKYDEVWCLVEVINRFIVDLAGNKMPYEDKGAFRDYSYNDKTKRLTRETFVDNHVRVKTYRFNITDSNIIIPIAKLTEVNCEE